MINKDTRLIRGGKRQVQVELFPLVMLTHTSKFDITYYQDAIH